MQWSINVQSYIKFASQIEQLTGVKSVSVNMCSL